MSKYSCLLIKMCADADQGFDEGTNAVPEHRDRTLLNPPEQDAGAERVRALVDALKKRKGA